MARIHHEVFEWPSALATPVDAKIAAVVRAVIDTNVLFEGLTRTGAAASVVDAWVSRRFQPCISTALALEYQEVLSAAQSLGFRIMGPVEFLALLT